MKVLPYGYGDGVCYATGAGYINVGENGYELGNGNGYNNGYGWICRDNVGNGHYTYPHNLIVKVG